MLRSSPSTTREALVTPISTSLIAVAVAAYAADGILVDTVYSSRPVEGEPLDGVVVHTQDYDGLGHIVYCYQGAVVGRQIPTG